MALAGDDEAHRPSPSAAMPARMASGAVADFARAGTAGENFAADGGGVFAARIVVGDDDAIGEFRRRLRPSTDACPCRDRRRSRTRQRACPSTCGRSALRTFPAHPAYGRSRHRPARPISHKRLSPAGPARLSDAQARRTPFRRIVAEPDGEARRDQRVRSLEFAGERQRDLVACGRHRRRRASGRRRAARDATSFSVSPFAPTVSTRKPRARAAATKSSACVGIGIDDRRRAVARHFAKTAGAWPRGRPRSRRDNPDGRG